MPKLPVYFHFCLYDKTKKKVVTQVEPTGVNLYGNCYVISDMTLIPSREKFSYSEDDNTREGK